MIDRIRVGVDMIDPKGPQNSGENESGVKLLCATGITGRSEHSDALTNQVQSKFRVVFRLGRERFIGEIGEIFDTQDFRFGRNKASAHAIVCHPNGDMPDQNYTQARLGLETGLTTMHRRVALAGEKKQQVMDSHVISMQSLDPRDTDQYLMEQERIIRKTRVALNPLMRMPLMATSSVTDCARLFEVMQQARANLVVYMMAPSRDMVTATLIAFPNLKKLIPALADEELQLAA